MKEFDDFDYKYERPPKKSGKSSSDKSSSPAADLPKNILPEPKARRRIQDRPSRPTLPKEVIWVIEFPIRKFVIEEWLAVSSSFSIPLWFALRHHFFCGKNNVIIEKDRICPFLTKKDQKILWCQIF